jgi:hypothetical protein
MPACSLALRRTYPFPGHGAAVNGDPGWWMGANKRFVSRYSSPGAHLQVLASVALVN